MMKDKIIDGIKLWVGLRGKLVQIIIDAGSIFDDYSLLPKLRQILLHWGYELTEKYFLLIWQSNT